MAKRRLLLNENQLDVTGGGSGILLGSYMMDTAIPDASGGGNIDAPFDLRGDSLTLQEGDFIELDGWLEVATRDAIDLIFGWGVSVGALGGSVSNMTSSFDLNWGSIVGRNMNFQYRARINASDYTQRTRVKGSGIGMPSDSIYYDFVITSTTPSLLVSSASLRVSYVEANALNKLIPVFGKLNIYRP